MSNVIHYGVAKSIRDTNDALIAANAAYIDTKITDLFNNVIDPNRVNIETALAATDATVATNRADFDTALNPVVADIVSTTV